MNACNLSVATCGLYNAMYNVSKRLSTVISFVSSGVSEIPNIEIWEIAKFAALNLKKVVNNSTARAH